MSLLQKHHQWAAVCTIYQTLRSKGYQALLAGGCVRDALIGRAPKDLDVTTDAPPEVVEALFEKTVGVGKAFGVIRVLIDRADIEVATFRTDGEYKDGRHPERVVFSTPEEDAKRRDFTINALFLDPGVEVVLDFVEGQKDIQAQIIRAVGVPEQRFGEDHLRILRAIRFSGQLGFEFEKQTFEAVRRMAEKVLLVSRERLFEEMSKLLGTQFRERALQYLCDSGLMRILFPFREYNIYILPIPTKENWKTWSLFFLPLLTADNGFSQLKIHLDELKFSNKDKKNILDVLSFLLDQDAFFKATFGEKLLKYSQLTTRWGCEILVYKGTQYQLDIESLQQNWLYMEEKLPEPFLTGHDLNSKFTGREIGLRLQEVYIMQLEGKITSRDEAFSYLNLDQN